MFGKKFPGSCVPTMNHVRQRYNAKARQSIPGHGHSHKRGKAKRRGDLVTQEHDPNAEVLTPSSESNELERKNRMRLEVMAKSDSKFDRKKKKRLEKYIVSCVVPVRKVGTLY
jgi:ATP-dependent RNA helicase DHX37/DHR1